MNPIYVSLSVACGLMLLAIGWLVFIRRDSTGATVVSQATAPAPSVPVLAPSHDQLFMQHVAPVFEDKLDKELRAKQAEALYAAFKGVKIEVKS